MSWDSGRSTGMNFAAFAIVIFVLLVIILRAGRGY
jgi:hypothetical protein